MTNLFIAFANLFLLCGAIAAVWWLVWYWSRKSIEEIKERYPDAYKRHYKK